MAKFIDFGTFRKMEDDSLQALLSSNTTIFDFLSAPSCVCTTVAFVGGFGKVFVGDFGKKNWTMWSEVVDNVFTLVNRWGEDGLLCCSTLVEKNWANRTRGGDGEASSSSARSTMIEWLQAVANSSMCETLFLAGVILSTEAYDSLLRVVRSSPKLKQLQLWGVQMPPYHGHISDIADAVRVNNKLEKFSLRYADFPLEDTQRWSALWRKTTSLTHLDIKFNLSPEYSATWFDAIAIGLSGSDKTRITSLRLSGAGVCTLGEHFASIVKTNRTLLNLSLQFFTFGNSEFILFMNCLANNHSLKSLSLAHCKGFHASEEVIGAILDSLSESGLPGLDLEGTVLTNHPMIEAQLVRNAADHREPLKAHPKVAAKAARLFLCGDPYAGKTTLLRTLSTTLSHGHSTFVNKIKACFLRSCWSTKNDRTENERTRGIEVRTLSKGDIVLSVWDMAGQAEYHAFHDHMFPDPSAQGSPAFFLFVWSPLDSQNDSEGKFKTEHEFERSFRYWLKFITSKTRQSNVARKIIIALTRKDQTRLVCDCILPCANRLMREFHKIIQLVDVWEVDARDPASLEQLASSIFTTARDILEHVQVYKICDELRSHLAGDTESRLDNPIISWEYFLKLCWKHFCINDLDCKALASSLHESGDLIYVRNMDFLILDSNWFCHEIMGELIDFPPSDQPGTMPIDGFAPRSFLEKLLKSKQGGGLDVSGAQLVNLMEALHLCCRVPNEFNPYVFIPATLCKPSDSRRDLRWKQGAIVRRNTFLGRRLECKKKDLTFLTPGLFPLLQVSFYTAYSAIGADVQLDKDLISIFYRDVEIIVEFCEAMGDHAIDVLVRSLEGNQIFTFEFVEVKVIRAIIEVCAQPAGDQGVELVEAIIRPDCLNGPVSSDLRENQCVLIEDLKKDLISQLQNVRHPSSFLYTWMHNTCFEAGASSIQDLLGIEEFSKLVKSFEDTLQEVGEKLGICENRETFEQKRNFQVARQQSSLLKGGGDIAKENSEENVATICRAMAVGLTQLNDKADAILDKEDAILEELVSLHKKIDDIVANICKLRNEIFPQLCNKIEKLLTRDETKEAGRFPRLCFLTTEGLGGFKKLVTSLTRDVKSIRVELFCEDRRHPHRVDGQIGITITMLEEGVIKKALPYLNGVLKVLTLVAKVGAHVLAGMGDSVPDFSRIIGYILDTPNVLDIGGLPEVHGLMEEGLANFKGWEQWLVSMLDKNGGVTESNISDKFELRRARYTDNLQVAWLCNKHYISEQAYPLLP